MCKIFNCKCILLGVVIVLIILSIFCGYSMAKIYDEFIIKSNIEIAEPILVVEKNPEIGITKENNDGIYTFKIKNFNEHNKITEVDLKYYIEILGNSEEAINIELFENDSKIDLNENKTSLKEISKDEKKEIEYKIKIAYIQNNSNLIADINEKIQVKVHIEQEKT